MNYKTWNYYISSENGEGESFIFLTSNGVFSAVSDFGNFAYVWRNPGVDDFRKYWIKDTFDINYLASKFGYKLQFFGNFDVLKNFVMNTKISYLIQEEIYTELEIFI